MWQKVGWCGRALSHTPTALPAARSLSLFPSLRPPRLFQVVNEVVTAAIHPLFDGR